VKLSVLFPVRNRTKFLAQSIGSVLGCLAELPAGWDAELIAGDNASTVPIETAVREISPAVRVIRHEADLGIFGNMNALIAASSGDWCHVVHDDDWILPGFYRRFAAAVAECPSAEVVSIECRLRDEESGKEQASLPWFDASGLVDGIELVRKLHWGNPLSIVGLLVSRRAYGRVGLYREDLPHSGDWEMWKRLAARCPWYWCLEHLARYRIHKGTATHAYLQNGQSARDIRRSIESTVAGMDTWEDYRGGSLLFARSMLRDALNQLGDDNPDLAAITTTEALGILRLFT
jgi:protein O-GlcNAc transferase